MNEKKLMLMYLVFITFDLIWFKKKFEIQEWPIPSIAACWYCMAIWIIIMTMMVDDDDDDHNQSMMMANK